MESGNWDTPKFLLKNRDEWQVCKMSRPFVFPISERNKNSGFSHVESGNRDTPRYVLKNPDVPIKPG